MEAAAKRTGISMSFSAPDLVKAVDAAVKAAANNEPSRAVDSLQFLTKQDVTAGLLLSTGAGKKVRVRRGHAVPQTHSLFAET